MASTVRVRTRFIICFLDRSNRRIMPSAMTQLWDLATFRGTNCHDLRHRSALIPLLSTLFMSATAASYTPCRISELMTFVSENVTRNVRRDDISPGGLFICASQLQAEVPVMPSAQALLKSAGHMVSRGTVRTIAKALSQ